MAEFSVDSLTTPITREQWKESFYEALATVGVSTTTWKPGAVTRTIIAICCVAFAALSTLIASIARSGFLSLASGLWLRAKALYDYNIEQQLATFASGTVLVSNTSGAVYDLDPDELEVASSITGKSYRNTAAISIGAGVVDLPVAVSAVEAGSASSALVGEIDRVVSAYSGLRVRNAEVLVGLDDEAPDLLRARCSEKLGSFSPNGPADAYAYVARNAKRANGTPIGITKIRTVRDERGGLKVYLGTASGGVTAPDVALVNDAIQQQAASLCVTADALSATTVAVPITYTVKAYKQSGITETDIKAAIASALEAYFASPNTNPIGGHTTEWGGRLLAEDLAHEISRAKYKENTSLRIFQVTLAAPAADVALGVSQLAVLGTVTGTVILQAPPQASV